MSQPFHPEELALLAAIHAQPKDNTIRLVYADWLQENGQPEYAEFVRLSIRLYRPISPEPELRSRWEILRTNFGKQWAAPMPKPLSGDNYGRGLPCPFILCAKHGPEEVIPLLAGMSPRIRLCLILYDNALLPKWCSSSIADRVAHLQVYGESGVNSPVTFQAAESICAMDTSILEQVDFLSDPTDEAYRLIRQRLMPFVDVNFHPMFSPKDD